MKLYGYWRSSTSYRVRIALKLKSVDVEYIPVNLKSGEQLSDEYSEINVQQSVPVLELNNGNRLTQSGAILNYLETEYPAVSLLPADPKRRALCHSFAEIIATEIHPFQNPRVINFIRSEFGAKERNIENWIHHWMSRSLTVLESIAQKSAHRFFLSDTPGLAECYLIPHMYSARRFKVDLSPYKQLQYLDDQCSQISVFQDAMPERQRDAPWEAQA
ncbi:maleylacetoacetate isomerase [Parasphingorhabdus cellanae]|uniref:Maleylacetoacetate isomerase n=1 Tax=Parasphingorhabdus cellanae TaxID=2806553 RepID=A0ABX7T2S3_9SPHN|nr:maleylacetoacetate isomerase [Parasphingorhabdus cellanae]QTD55846.1 maleylacetoacetate isomerase [Parasphingorhabdus cellanae]